MTQTGLLGNVEGEDLGYGTIFWENSESFNNWMWEYATKNVHSNAILQNWIEQMKKSALHNSFIKLITRMSTSLRADSP
jgi:heme-degrading monooxygenase HmoA